MSRLDEMIEELCPEGVEYLSISSLEDSGRIALGRGSVISKDDIKNNPGDYPIYSSSAQGNGIFGYYGSWAYDDERISWSIDGGGRFFLRKDARYSLTNVCGWMKILDENILVDYMYYALSNEWSKKTFDYMHKAHPSVVRREYSIPLPPLPIQREIVRILDDYTQCAASLDSTLTAELTARKKQYEYYRDLLLSFGDEVERVRLGSVAKYSTDRIDATRLDASAYVGVDNLLRDKGGKALSLCLPVFGNLTMYHDGDILIGNIRPYLKKIWLATQIGGASGDVLVLQIIDRNRVMPRYLYHVMAADSFFYYDTQHAKGAKMPRGDRNAVMEYEFPLPVLQVQARIVSILDRFDALCRDLVAALPAEIAARKRQYEYYRDRLLTFKQRDGKAEQEA